MREERWRTRADAQHKGQGTGKDVDVSFHGKTLSRWKLDPIDPMIRALSTNRSGFGRQASGGQADFASL
jgi:hypothetical protein